ncbi:EAL domain-containing protein [Vibrio owensii]|uniref:EAL domain-containing protein n=1 Tax=Vibrio owensii TaxID=696485 RepID=UPI003AAD4860
MEDFYLVYQPKVKDACIVGLEALVRPNDTDISVHEFLTHVDDCASFDLEVLKSAIHDMDRYDIPVSVSINIHPTSILNGAFIDVATRSIEDRHLVLELVEYQEVEITAVFKNNIKQLKDAGYKISIDDFGKDFSKFDLVMAVEPDEVKFDRSLICGIEDNYISFKHLYFLYSKIRDLCSAKIVFEGIENRHQLELLELFSEKASYQGFYFYKPDRLEDIVNLDKFEVNLSNDSLNINYDDNISLDYLVHDYLRRHFDEGKRDIKLNDYIKKIDKFGLVYNDNENVTRENIKKIYFNSNNILQNGFMSLVSSSDRCFSVRNNKGVILYQNKENEELFGADVIGLKPSEMKSRYPGYSVFLDQDQKLLSNGEEVVPVTIDVFMGNRFESIRDVLVFNDAKFIVTSAKKLI